jgi:glycosyltransferase involved in cell wall biosynthesis
MLRWFALAGRLTESMRALVVAPQPFFSPRGTPFSVYYRTLVTAQLGVEIDLLTYGQGQDVEVPGVRIVRIPEFALLGPVPVGPSFLKLFLDVFLTLWTVGLLLRRRYDFVHAHEEAVFWCCLLKPLFRFRLVYDMHSSLPQQLTNFRFTTSKVIISSFNWLERVCLRNADAVIAICPDLRDYALKGGIDPERLMLIENSIFEDVRVTSSVASAPAVSGGDNGADEALVFGGPVVAYAGTFETYQGLDLLLSAFVHVVKTRPDARLLMIGGTRPQVDEKRQLARRLGLTGACIFTGQVSKARAQELTARAHVLVSPRIEGTNTPLKIYEQLASGKPLVATRILSHTQVLTEDVCILVEPEPQAMAAGILNAIADEARLANAAKAKSLYERAYSRPAYEAKVRRLLEILP